MKFLEYLVKVQSFLFFAGLFSLFMGLPAKASLGQGQIDFINPAYFINHIESASPAAMIYQACIALFCVCFTLAAIAEYLKRR